MLARLASVALVLLSVAACAGRPTTTSSAATSPATTSSVTTSSVTIGSATGRRSPGPTPASERALDVLASVPVKGRAPKTGYARAQFGAAWTDDTDVDGGHNGCDTRNDVLRRDLTAAVLKPGTRGCVVLRARLDDPYTGRDLAFRRGERTSSEVQIDHVVALSDAWQTGAQQLSPRQRLDLANDPLELLAVDGPTNQSKGDGDAATWLPPNKPYRCAYVARQIAVKRAYHLWVTPAERDAMRAVLRRCPDRAVPTRDDVPNP